MFLSVVYYCTGGADGPFDVWKRRSLSDSWCSRVSLIWHGIPTMSRKHLIDSHSISTDTAAAGIATAAAGSSDTSGG